MSDMPLAAALGVVVAGIFSLKESIHLFVKGVLTEKELRDSLLFAIAALVIWPQLPDRYMGPFDALNPSALGLLIVLVLAIGAGGYVATRALGVRYGLPLMGFASGFVSSSATIASLGGEAASAPQTLRASRLSFRWPCFSSSSARRRSTLWRRRSRQAELSRRSMAWRSRFTP
jgi:uncharacterized membrane protein (DUF4010 family)